MTNVMKILTTLVLLTLPLGGCALVGAAVVGAVVVHELDRNRAPPPGYYYCVAPNGTWALCRLP
jgi:hypothetical protein